jgi:hypothetical protein
MSINLNPSQSISINLNQHTCEKMSTRRPSERSFGSSLSSSTSLPLAASIASRTCGESGATRRRGEHLHAAGREHRLAYLWGERGDAAPW